MAKLEPEEHNSGPLQLPLVSHGGLLDDLNHALAIAGIELDQLSREAAQDQPSEAAQRLGQQLDRIHQIGRMIDNLARAGCLQMPSPSSSYREWWAQQCTELDPVQQDIADRSRRVRPS